MQKIECDESANIKMVEDAFGYQETRIYDADNKYQGEETEVNTQNLYVYTLNNSYKYVDEVSSKVVNGGRFDTYYYKSGKKEFKFVPDKKTPPPPIKPVNIFASTHLFPNATVLAKNLIKAMKCPEKTYADGRKIYPDYHFSYDLPVFNLDYGVFKVKVGRVLKSKISLYKPEKQKLFESIGFSGNKDFKINLEFGFNDIASNLINRGFSIEVGSWGSFIYTLSTNFKYTSFLITYIRQTINILEHDSIEFSAVSKIGDYFSIKSHFTISENKYLVGGAVIALVAGLPVISTALVSPEFVENVGIFLNGLKNAHA